ncbi:(5-formylfuran-3-yl)methyl phosphate synthase [Blastopirellula retiformator]|uniref:(5-formylfuran-3-yl)methyl phosphate synthase n=1 Tax=Blastopirellula retiformator TaxID=2527970 RepID=A0A5C5UYP0_9BACT|nr:(5-formylfuran-3-yl)methyl phosphate synthase [Blastopirellula retiformator]TWT31464.1 hypothetical protein Enr8_33850 [Blastopirellula retiformator]
MTQLLVSVRSAAEARAALAGGADLIDVKEPTLGSLGAAKPQVWREVIDQIDGQLSVSVALGEISDRGSRFDADSFRGASMVKFGLANMADVANWRTIATARYQQVPPECVRVAVYYVDQSRANCPPLNEVLRWSREISATAVLLDTYVKDGQSLFDFVSARELAQTIAAIHAGDQLAACGGSLAEAHFSAAIEAGADVLAVRGAACAGSRTGEVREERVAALRRSLNSFESEATTRFTSGNASRFA